jgi:hypothetical protein
MQPTARLIASALRLMPDASRRLGLTALVAGFTIDRRSPSRRAGRI